MSERREKERKSEREKERKREEFLDNQQVTEGR
jgi:hypothetical protein